MIVFFFFFVGIFTNLTDPLFWYFEGGGAKAVK